MGLESNDLREAKLDEHAHYWSFITEKILRGGDIPHSIFLSRAMDLCREETGSCIWPDVPERYWAKAVDDIIG